MSADKHRQVLHRLVDELSPADLIAAARYLKYLRHQGDPVLRALMEAPLDDEPETPEETTAVQEAREALARGEVVSEEQLRRELGL